MAVDGVFEKTDNATVAIEAAESLGWIHRRCCYVFSSADEEGGREGYWVRIGNCFFFELRCTARNC